MTYDAFRLFIKQWDKFSGCKHVPRSPVVNPGFPGTFNLSFGEDFMLKKFGRYTNFTHDFSCSATQLVIRPNDLFNEVSRQPDRYLGVFEMSDVHGMVCCPDRTHTGLHHAEQTESVIRLLQSIGIPLQNVYPKYCKGGALKTITNGKYAFDFTVPEDVLTKTKLIEVGIPEKNLVSDSSCNTLLALYLHQPIAWGYRTEIEVDIGLGKNRLLDIATIEYSCWDPIFNGVPSSKTIVGLEPAKDFWAVTVCGVERLYCASNSIQDIHEVDYLKMYYAFLRSVEESAVASGEYLRALHVICTDQKKFGFKIGKHRGYMMNIMARTIGLNTEEICKALDILSESQPWYPELKEGIEPTIDFIKNYRCRVKQIFQ